MMKTTDDIIERLYDLIPGRWTTLIFRRGGSWCVEIYDTSPYDFPILDTRVLGVSRPILADAVETARQWIAERNDE